MKQILSKLFDGLCVLFVCLLYITAFLALFVAFAGACYLIAHLFNDGNYIPATLLIITISLIIAYCIGREN